MYDEKQTDYITKSQRIRRISELVSVVLWRVATKKTHGNRSLTNRNVYVARFVKESTELDFEKAWMTFDNKKFVKRIKIWSTNFAMHARAFVKLASIKVVLLDVE